ncbi:MAG: hypothetical protein LC115_09165 [Bacteroidia bacterium]|nr:hypothetical protein [Bacteroidia bacterium]
MRILLGFWGILISYCSAFGQSWAEWDSIGSLHNTLLNQLITAHNVHSPEDELHESKQLRDFLQDYADYEPNTLLFFHQLPEWDSPYRENMLETLPLSAKGRLLVENLLNEQDFVMNWDSIRAEVTSLPEESRESVAYFVAVSEASQHFWADFFVIDTRCYSDSDSVALAPVKVKFPWGRFWKADGWGTLKGLVAGSLVFGIGSVYISRNVRTKNPLWAGIGAGASVVFPVIDSYRVFRKYKLGYYDEPEIIYE